MNEIAEIKDRLPIEQLVGSYLPLKKAGRIYKACCPFHNEKTPSFTVSPDRNIFKCFGCGEAGDIFDFVIKLEGLSFPEALLLLAEKAGVQLPEKTLQENRQKLGNVPSKERLYKLNDYLARLWNTILTKHAKAEVARSYLEGRGLKLETINTFQIGYAPPGQTTLLSLQKAGFSSQEIQAAGDPHRFQDRIVFPIQDITGRTVGFTGRLLEVADDPNKPGANPRASRGPKYWNTPETSLFIKSRTLYGLHLAKQRIHQEERALLAEGQMDVVMLHQAGFNNAIASSGTALTAEQLKLISRFTQTVVFAYDQDSAGIEATKRGAELALASELNPLVISIPDGKDPAEVIKQDPEKWKIAYNNQQPLLDWMMQQIIPENQALSPQTKKEVVKQLIPWLQRITDPIEQEEWLKIVAAKLQTDEQNLKSAMQRTRVQNNNPNNSPEPISENLHETTLDNTTSLQKLAELGLALILSFPEILPSLKPYLADFKLVDQTPFISDILPILEANPDTFEISLIPETKQKDIAIICESFLQQYQDLELNNQLAIEEVLVLLQRIRSETKEGQKEKLAQEIKRAQILGDNELLQKLFAELKNIL